MPATRSSADDAYLLEHALVEVRKVIVGHDRLVERLIVAMFARGHMPAPEHERVLHAVGTLDRLASHHHVFTRLDDAIARPRPRRLTAHRRGGARA